MMITREGLTHYRFISLPIALGLLLPSLFVPWITINFLGLSLFSPLDIMRILSFQGAGDGDRDQFDLYNLMTSYNDSFSASALSMGLLIASFVGMSFGVVFSSRRALFILAAGCLAISSSIFWFYSIESLKSNFSHQAAITGGIVGEEFRGHERTLADIIIGVGLGPYLALAGGVVVMTFSISQIAIGAK
jgi:hypothetical protein